MLRIRKDAALCCALLGLAVQSAAGAAVWSVELRLAEPICLLEALAAEKTLLGVSGVLTVKLDLQRGALVVTPDEGDHLDPALASAALEGVALKVTRVGVTAGGTLQMGAPAPTLEMEGLLPRLALSGGARLQELIDTPELAGKRLSVSGTYARADDGNPPTLTVEEWAVEAPPTAPPAPADAEPQDARQ